MLGLSGFSALVMICLAFAAMTPLILVALWLKDFISKQLW